MLNTTTTLKHQTALSVAYGAGLRVGEVALLKVRDIDSERSGSSGAKADDNAMPCSRPICLPYCASGHCSSACS